MKHRMYHSRNNQLASRLVAGAIVLMLIAAGCSSDGNDTISLTDDGLAPTNTETVDSGVFSEPVAFTYKTFDDEKLALADLPEGPVVLNFFASWCPTCIAEMPDFETVHQNFADEVVFLGLAVQDRPENAVALVADTGISYRVGNDQNGEIFGMFRGLGMPTTVFIAADGTVADVHTGVLDVASLTEKINSTLLS